MSPPPDNSMQTITPQSLAITMLSSQQPSTQLCRLLDLIACGTGARQVWLTPSARIRFKTLSSLPNESADPAPSLSAQVLRTRQAAVEGVFRGIPILWGDIVLATLLLKSAETPPEAAPLVLAAVSTTLNILRRQSDAGGIPEFIGGTARVSAMLHQLRAMAATNFPILILGETGSGKEVLARAAHRLSSRSEGPFIACAVPELSPSLIEGELRGHEKGSFTGATETHAGFFELADGGTLFIDEIGDLPLALQAKFLRLIELTEVRRIGGKDSRRYDVRIIAATNRDLKSMVQAGTFRSDLYERLKVLKLTTVPLREEPEEIERLLRHFMGPAAPESFDADALRLLKSYAWPGNVRELRNFVIQLLVLFGGILTIDSAGACLGLDTDSPVAGTLPEFLPLLPATEKFVADYFAEAIRRAKGDPALIAQLLGLPERQERLPDVHGDLALRLFEVFLRVHFLHLCLLHLVHRGEPVEDRHAQAEAEVEALVTAGVVDPSDDEVSEFGARVAV